MNPDVPDAFRVGPHWRVERHGSRCSVRLRGSGQDWSRQHEITEVEFDRALGGEIGPGYFWRKYERRSAPWRWPSFTAFDLIRICALVFLAAPLFYLFLVR